MLNILKINGWWIVMSDMLPGGTKFPASKISWTSCDARREIWASLM